MSTAISEKVIVRSLRLDMAEPVGMTWDEFWKVMNETWRVGTQLANAIMAHYYLSDMKAQTKLGEVPKMPKRNGYDVYKRFRPAIGSGCASSIEQFVWKRYRAKNASRRTARFDALTGAASVPSLRFAVPFPIHNRDWRAWEKDGQLFVDLLLLDKKRITVRVKTGGRYDYHADKLRKIIGEDLKQRELRIVRREGRTPALVTGVDCEVASVERSGSLTVSTAGGCLLCVNDGGRIWKYHGDHLRRRVSEHAARLQRLSDDLKYEPRGMRVEMRSRREAECDRHSRVVDSALKKLAAWLVNYADRRRVARIEYDDSDKSYLDKFCWDKMKRLISEKCELAGIFFEERESDEK